MKKTFTSILISMLLALALTACGGENVQGSNNEADHSSAPQITSEITAGVTNADETDAGDAPQPVKELTVRFGDNGAPFTLILEDNDTAAAIARHVGTADWRLPIYHYDDYEGWEVMQYYDIPSRYEIPSNAESVTTEQAGQLYYSEPNRIVLFYKDGEISGDYTLVGHFDATEEFVSAVENNPVLEGWSNKIVHISTGE